MHTISLRHKFYADPTVISAHKVKISIHTSLANKLLLILASRAYLHEIYNLATFGACTIRGSS